MTRTFPDTQNGSADYGWAGQQQKLTEHLDSIATVELGARQYVPAIGRFLQVDPEEGGTECDYVYVNDLINEDDLSGLRWHRYYGHHSKYIRYLDVSRTRRGVRTRVYSTRRGLWSGYRYRTGTKYDALPALAPTVFSSYHGGGMWRGHKKILRRVPGTKGRNMRMQLVCHQVGAPLIWYRNTFQ